MNLLRKRNSNFYHNYIKSITNSNKSLWEATKNLLKEKNIVPLLRNLDNTYAISNIDKSNLFATHLANNFSPHPDIINILEHADYIKQS